MDRRDRDMDLILELAGGDLPPAEAAEAEQSLDAEARGELAAQRAARDALARLARPTMSEAERQRLRAAVAAELRLEARSRHEPAPSRRRWWRRPGSLGALTGVASLVAVVAISLNLVGNFPFADSGDEVELTTAAATTVVAQAEAAPTTAAAIRATAEATTTTTITAAPATTTPDQETFEAAAALAEAAQAAVQPETLPEQDSDLKAPEAPPAFDVATDRPGEMARSLETIVAGSVDPFPLSELAEIAAGEGFECWQTVVDETEPDGVVLVMARGLVDGAEAEVYGVQGSDPDLDLTLNFFILPECRPVASDQ